MADFREDLEFTPVDTDIVYSSDVGDVSMSDAVDDVAEGSSCDDAFNDDCSHNPADMVADQVDDTMSDTLAPSADRHDAGTIYCPQCNAPLTYQPDTGKFECEYCGGVFHRQEVHAGGDPEVKLSSDFNEYTCPSCGADVVADPHTSAQFCAFCGNPIILKGRVSGAAKPDKIIPFSVTKEQAIETVRAAFKKKRFIPRDFFTSGALDSIRGVYYPFWMTDADADCAIDGEASNSTSWTSGDYRYTRTDYYYIRRSGDIHFEDIATNALSSEDKVLLEGVLPFPSHVHEAFDMRYMSGFFAKKNDLGKMDVVDEVHGKMSSIAQGILRNTVCGYDHVEVRDHNERVQNIHWDYTLVPIWVLNYKYKNKVYHLAINGVTGKLFGDLPLSKGKLTLASLLTFASIAGVLAGLGVLLL